MAEPRLITAAEAALDDLGDVKGPGPVTDGNIALFDGTTGTLLKAAGVVEGVATIDATTNVLVGDGAGNAVDSGSAIGDLGSFLSINTARVDASGNDGTGTIGNLSKPFLTVQAAINAILAQESFDSSIPYVIDIGANQFSEELTIGNSITLVFKGVNAAGGTGGTPQSQPWQGLTLTASAAIYVKDCTLGSSSITTSDDLDLILDNVDGGTNHITSTAGSGKHLTVISPTNSAYNIGLITADDISTLNVVGITPTSQAGGETISVANSSPDVFIKNVGSPSMVGSDPNLYSVDCGGAAGILVINSILGDIGGADAFLTLVNSKVLGTITATTTIDSSGFGVGIGFPDGDPLIAGAPYWDGATLKKSAGP